MDSTEDDIRGHQFNLVSCFASEANMYVCMYDQISSAYLLRPLCQITTAYRTYGQGQQQRSGPTALNMKIGSGFWKDIPNSVDYGVVN